MRKILPALMIILLLPWASNVAAKELSQNEIYGNRMQLYKKTEAATQVPWYYLAAVDQFERSIRYVRKDLPKPDGLIGYYVQPEQWAGPLNPNQQDDALSTIEFFGGKGLDGDGDGKADRTNGEDLLFTLSDVYFTIWYE